MDLQRATIIGAGTMGLGIAECFALAGMTVVLIDANPSLSEVALERLARRVAAQVDAGLLGPSARDRAAAVSTKPDLASALADAELILEAVPESLDIKREVLSACGSHAPDHAIITTNTSSLPIDQLAAFVSHRERFLGMHWFNPPEWTPAVEVIPSADTDAQVVQRALAFLQSIGKRPAMVGSGPGFVANRIQFALFREAVACVAEGLATPRELDELVRGSFGFRLPFYGPFQIADMAGLDVYSNIFEVLEKGLGEAWEPPEFLQGVVDGGRRGVKSLAGFYQYSEDERDSMLLERDRRYAALSRLLDELPPQNFMAGGETDEAD